MAKGKKLLYVAGVLELVFGFVCLYFLITTLNSTNHVFLASVGLDGSGDSFFKLALTWASVMLSIVGGIVALLLANSPKHYKIVAVFGILFILITAGNSFSVEDSFSVQNLISYVCAMIVPVMYYLGAMKNKESYTRHS